MSTDRDSFVAALRGRGEHDKALEAACLLPRAVDTERDVGVLSKLGLSVAAAEQVVRRSERDRPRPPG